MDIDRRPSFAFLFDIDGTLIDSSGAGGSALQSALEQEFRLQGSTSVPLHGRTDVGIMTELLESHAIPATQENLDRLCHSYFRKLPDELASRHPAPLPGVVPLLDQLQWYGCHHLGLLTGNMPFSAQAKLEHYALWSYFDFGVYGNLAAERPGLASPALDAVQSVAQRRSGAPVPRNRIIILGDTPLDVELARIMDVRCLAVCTGGFQREELVAAGAEFVVDDLSDTQAILDWFFEPTKELS